MDIKFIEINKKKYYDKNDENTQEYLLNCSTLAFHKAIIGITELNALEEVGCTDRAGSLRMSRAVITYYIIYHLFTSLMIIDKDFEIEIGKKKTSGEYIDYKVKEDELNSTYELPLNWNKAKDYEADVATLITHTQIKNYCELLRRKGEMKNKVYDVLFKAFVYIDEANPETSIKGLYEKACYVRDRVIYRPSYVVSVDNHTFQTSLYVRKEIESLPKSTELYKVIQDLLSEIYVEVKANNNRDFLFDFVNLLWNSSVSIDTEEDEVLIMDQYSNEDKSQINVSEGSIDNFMCQHIELNDKTRAKSDYEKFWKPLIDEYRTFMKDLKINK